MPLYWSVEGKLSCPKAGLGWDSTSLSPCWVGDFSETWLPALQPGAPALGALSCNYIKQNRQEHCWAPVCHSSFSFPDYCVRV